MFAALPPSITPFHDNDSERMRGCSVLAVSWCGPIPDAHFPSLMPLSGPIRDTGGGRASVRFLAGCGPDRSGAWGLLHARKDRAGYRRRAG
jgi:hypothetical protein